MFALAVLYLVTVLCVSPENKLQLYKFIKCQFVKAKTSWYASYLGGRRLVRSPLGLTGCFEVCLFLTVVQGTGKQVGFGVFFL